MDERAVGDDLVKGSRTLWTVQNEEQMVELCRAAALNLHSLAMEIRFIIIYFHFIIVIILILFRFISLL